MPSIGTLPKELVSLIAELVHPSTIVSFALLDKRTLACSTKALHLHQSRLSLHLLHDRSPNNMVDLLRKLIANPNLSWYVRRFEIFGNRTSWEEWKSKVYLNGEEVSDDEYDEAVKQGWPEIMVNMSSLDQSFFSDEELDFFHEFLVCRFNLDDIEAERWMQKLRLGNEEPLRAILMALATQLKTVVFVGYDYTRSSSHPFSLLSTILSNLVDRKGTWNSDYFRNLENVSINTPANLTGALPWCIIPMPSIVPLFTLPAIKSLSLTDVGAPDENINESDWPQPPRSSALEHLYMNSCELNTKALLTVLRAPRLLKTFDTDVCDHQVITPALSTNFSDSLEILDISTGTIPEPLVAFKVLKVIKISIAALTDPPPPYFIFEHDIVYEWNFQRTEGCIKTWKNLNALLPPSIEDITIVDWDPQPLLLEEEIPGYLAMLLDVVKVKPLCSCGVGNDATDPLRNPPIYPKPNLNSLCTRDQMTNKTESCGSSEDFYKDIASSCKDRNIDWQVDDCDRHWKRHWTWKYDALQSEPQLMRRRSRSLDDVITGLCRLRHSLNYPTRYASDQDVQTSGQSLH